MSKQPKDTNTWIGVPIPPGYIHFDQLRRLNQINPQAMDELYRGSKETNDRVLPLSYEAGTSVPMTDSNRAAADPNRGPVQLIQLGTGGRSQARRDGSSDTRSDILPTTQTDITLAQGPEKDLDKNEPTWKKYSKRDHLPVFTGGDMDLAVEPNSKYPGDKEQAGKKKDGK